MRTTPIKRFSGIQIVTSPFGMRTLRGKRKMHRGIDLRSIRFQIGFGYVLRWSLQDVVFSENSQILRFGTDKKGNDFLVVRPLENIQYSEIKYIHVTLIDEVKMKGLKFNKYDKIGKTQIKGSSTAHHLHFEVWNKDGFINPIDYLNKIGIKWKMKGV